MKILLALCFISFVQAGYYPVELDTKKGSDLKLALKEVISKQTVLSYKQARRALFGDLFLEKSSRGHFITDTYCEEKFDSTAGVGPSKIPNHTKINCEHTWPQSLFNRSESTSAQKSDLHHLFPVKARANSTRGNIPFAEVSGNFLSYCNVSKRGKSLRNNRESFEPPKYHKGNIARAMFYFATRYNIDIDSDQEAYFRQWHRLDPVDAQEKTRHEKIYKIQGNRNPFIDDESMIDRIDNI